MPLMASFQHEPTLKVPVRLSSIPALWQLEAGLSPLGMEPGDFHARDLHEVHMYRQTLITRNTDNSGDSVCMR